MKRKKTLSLITKLSANPIREGKFQNTVKLNRLKQEFIQASFNLILKFINITNIFYVRIYNIFYN